MKTFMLIVSLFLSWTICFCQDLTLGNRLDKIPDYFQLIGASSKDNSRIYRLKNNFPSTIFSYTVDKYEIKIHKNIIVSMHFVLLPKDKSQTIPDDLINRVKLKSGREPTKRNSNYYFDDISSRTVILRANMTEYGGDKIHIQVTLTEYLLNQ